MQQAKLKAAFFFNSTKLQCRQTHAIHSGNDVAERNLYAPSPSPTNTHGCLLCAGKDLEGHLLSPLHPLTHSCSWEGEQPIRSMAPLFLVGGGVPMIHCRVFLEHLHLGAAGSLDPHLLHSGRATLPFLPQGIDTWDRGQGLSSVPCDSVCRTSLLTLRWSSADPTLMWTLMSMRFRRPRFRQEASKSAKDPCLHFTRESQMGVLDCSLVQWNRYLHSVQLQASTGASSWRQ